MSQRRTYRDGERDLILKVITYFEKEKLCGSPIIPVNRALKRASEATGVSVRTLLKIKNEANKLIKSLSSSDTTTDKHELEPQSMVELQNVKDVGDLTVNNNKSNEINELRPSKPEFVSAQSLPCTNDSANKVNFETVKVKQEVTKNSSNSTTSPTIGTPVVTYEGTAQNPKIVIISRVPKNVDVDKMRLKTIVIQKSTLSNLVGDKEVKLDTSTVKKPIFTSSPHSHVNSTLHTSPLVDIWAQRSKVRFKNPKRRKRTSKVDDSIVAGLKTIVESLYNVNDEMPPLKRVLAVAKSELNFPGQLSTLRRVLKGKLGYDLSKHKKKDASKI